MSSENYETHDELEPNDEDIQAIEEERVDLRKWKRSWNDLSKVV